MPNLHGFYDLPGDITEQKCSTCNTCLFENASIKAGKCFICRCQETDPCHPPADLSIQVFKEEEHYDRMECPKCGMIVALPGIIVHSLPKWFSDGTHYNSNIDGNWCDGYKSIYKLNRQKWWIRLLRWIMK